MFSHTSPILSPMGKQKPQHAFGLVVRELRLGREITQEGLADEAKLHRTYISLLERGLRNPSLTVIQQIANALDVSMSELIAAFENRSQKGS